MYREDADGSAVVWGVPVAPFVPVQHMCICLSTMNSLGTYCFRLAREHGWLQTAEEMALAAPCTERNEAHPPVEEGGHTSTDSGNTFFFAGLEETLENQYPNFHSPPTPLALRAEANFYLAHVGNSSYSVYGKLYTYVEGEPENARKFLGSFKVTAVWVSKLQRTPRGLRPDKRSLLDSIILKNASRVSSLDGARVQRLSVSDFLLHSGWFASASAIAAVDIATYSPLTAPPPEEFLVALPHLHNAAPLWLLHRRNFKLRESDVDFNLHVNQLVLKLFVVDTFRQAAADVRCAYSRLLRPGVPSNRADLLLVKFRIDYVREIPMHCTAAEVFLFPMDAARAKAQVSSAGATVGSRNAGAATSAVVTGSSAADAPAADVMEIGFFTVGVPSLGGGLANGASSSGCFIATVGMITASTHFLH
ncbi:hypothetical protein GH5_05059 [Leishmania sp. Ghana 2012 LV757]|uniref:hypothetical protein n=1 Tax=Leishmania sp. Ghana 2012 LV757 TaxID=2803181 RepID=UPI001B64BD8E|nr:hypothetical protein GH5_05059 [Leishmania sp. Ghana 2012 LV757]